MTHRVLKKYIEAKNAEYGVDVASYPMNHNATCKLVMELDAELNGAITQVLPYNKLRRAMIDLMNYARMNNFEVPPTSGFYEVA